MKKIFSYGIFLFVLFVSHSLVAQQSYKEIDLKNGGTIRGTVTLKGIPPPVEQISVSTDGATCGKTKTLQSVIVGKNNGIKNVIVGLEGVTQGKKIVPNIKASLDQLKCEYSPHIIILPKGGNLEIVNSDGILHNVHAYDLNGKMDVQTGPPTLFNIALPIKGMKIARPMSQAGLVRMLCDAGHPWMNAYILITEHPYFAVTDENGSFMLDNIPPGSYTVRLWHEGVAKIEAATKSYIAAQPCRAERKVAVTAAGVTQADFAVSLSNTQQALISAH